MNGMRHIVIVTFEGGQSLDLTGPLEAFSIGSMLLQAQGRDGDGYATTIAAPEAAPLRMSSGLQVVPDIALQRIRRPIDTLIVAGGMGTREAMADGRLLRTLCRLAPRVRRLASVCSGSLILAEAGLLRGKRATTHWNWCDHMAERYPDTDVDRDAIFVRDGSTWTSAGVTAGIDLALAMLEQDHDHTLSLQVARQLVMFVQRPGGQSQFSETLRAQTRETDALRDLPRYIAEHLQHDLSVPALAARAGMTERTFARVFVRELGETPARYVERMRIEAAQRRLSQSDEKLDSIAAHTGFGSSETLRRAFQRHLRISPRTYRQHFAAAEL